MHQNNSKSGKLEHSRWRAGPQVRVDVHGHTHCHCAHAGLVAATLKQAQCEAAAQSLGQPQEPPAQTATTLLCLLSAARS